MTTAQNIIDTISFEAKKNGHLGNEINEAALNALGCGETLAYFGYTDNDQEAIEEAHDIISNQIKSN